MAGAVDSNSFEIIVYGNETITESAQLDSTSFTISNDETRLDTIEEKESIKIKKPDIPEKKESLTIIVIGKTGVGKSTLINSLLGEKKAKVSDSLHPCNQEKIEKHTGQFCGIKTLFYDTKGLADPNEDDEKLLKKFHETIVMCRNQYLVFICLPFISKADDSVLHFAKLLATKFGDNFNIWLNSIFVLTQANLFSPDDDDSDEEEDVRLEKKKMKMEEKLKDWGTNFQKCLKRFGLPGEIIMNMPVCVAGRKSPKLPITKNWKETLLNVCLEHKKTVHSVPGMKKVAEESAAYLCMAIGTAVGCIIPVVGIPVGMTVGGLIGWKIGKDSYEETVKETERKKYKERAIKTTEQREQQE